jgi:hypothetical protein
LQGEDRQVGGALDALAHLLLFECTVLIEEPPGDPRQDCKGYYRHGGDEADEAPRRASRSVREHAVRRGVYIRFV